MIFLGSWMKLYLRGSVKYKRECFFGYAVISKHFLRFIVYLFVTRNFLEMVIPIETRLGGKVGTVNVHAYNE